MAKYLEPGHPRKVVGAYLKVVKALKELDRMGEETGFHAWDPAVVGLTGTIIRRDGEWTFVEA